VLFVGDASGEALLFVRRFTIDPAREAGSDSGGGIAVTLSLKVTDFSDFALTPPWGSRTSLHPIFVLEFDVFVEKLTSGLRIKKQKKKAIQQLYGRSMENATT
jgi:hypothetical protein